jgi:para-nitrobenzyl esterase
MSPRPIGPLRWRTPQPAPAWKGVRRVDKFGANSPQGTVVSDIDPSVDGVSEDCLYVNIWTPADLDPGGRLPQRLCGGVGLGAAP